MIGLWCVKMTNEVELGKIIGKTSTTDFKFSVTGNCKKFEYLQVKHPNDFYVLCQIVEMEREGDNTTAKCVVIGYRDENDVMRGLGTPLAPDSDVEYASDDFVQKTLGLFESDKGAYIGVLDGRENIKVYVDMNKMITKHITVLAKSGAGKTYCVSVLLEEILDKNIPIVVIDPHGEYSSLKYPSKNTDGFDRFDIKSKGYIRQIQEYAPDIQKNPEARPLKLSSKNLTGTELMHMLPAKLSSAQIGLLYSALRDINSTTDFEELMTSLQLEENNSKWALINVVDYLRKLNIFSESPTTVQELVQPARCSILNLRGVPGELQQIIVYKLATDLFNARKNGEIPPFLMIIEEAHNYSPERNFGEAKSSTILRQIAAEGRKFGLGVAVISQRPARVDKTMISQCSTQFILKLTNPNDLHAVTNSVEGITSQTENEIQNLRVGTAMVVGVVDTPLFVNIRPRRTKHGGEAVDIVESFANIEIENEDELTRFLDSDNKDKGPNKKVLNIIRPKLSKKDVELMAPKKLKSLKTIVVPCLFVSCKDKGIQFNILFNLYNGQVVKDIERGSGKPFFKLGKVSEKEDRIFKKAIGLDRLEFGASELFSNSGLQFSEVYDAINSLVKKDYFIKSGNNFQLSEASKFYLGLKELASFEKPDFIGLEFDSKMPVRWDSEEVLENIKRFIEVQGSKEVYIVKYDVEYVK